MLLLRSQRHMVRIFRIRNHISRAFWRWWRRRWRKVRWCVEQCWGIWHRRRGRLHTRSGRRNTVHRTRDRPRSTVLRLACWILRDVFAELDGFSWRSLVYPVILAVFKGVLRVSPICFCPVRACRWEVFLFINVRKKNVAFSAVPKVPLWVGRSANNGKR